MIYQFIDVSDYF